MGLWKPALPWRGATVCEAVVDSALEAGLAPFVVAGYRADELRELLAVTGRASVEYNPGWEDGGMLESVQVGLRAARAALGAAFAGFAVAPADMPAIPPGAFAAVVGAGLAASPASVVFAAKGGRRGHPAFVPAALAQAVETAAGGESLRDVLLSLRWTSVELDDDGIFADVDTLEEYRRLRGSRGA